MSFGARALIRLGALQHNLSVIRAAAPDSKVMAVIKANAYGHGMLAVAKALGDVDALAVARVAEAVALREADVQQRLVLLSGVLDSAELDVAIDGGFELVVHCDEQLAMLSEKKSANLSVWLKLDTGMNRLGFAPDRAADVLRQLHDCAAVGSVGLMTHLSSADDPASNSTSLQLQRFAPIADAFAGDVSVANTAATFICDAALARCREGDNWIRPGIALFGVSPFSGQTGAELGLRPVMRFEARLISIKALRKGERVGYHGRFEAPADTRLGIVSAGYGDGYSRHFRSGTPILLNGRRVPLMGSVSMDMIAVDLGVEGRDRVGDIATLWGEGLPVEEVAPWADAIPYELVCGVMNRESSEVIA